MVWLVRMDDADLSGTVIALCDWDEHGHGEIRLFDIHNRTANTEDGVISTCRQHISMTRNIFLAW
jgi:hypothetical protein